jgi:uncharacterized protein YjbI with pentapeptide repeats
MLDNANLSGANLTGAVISGGHLNGADLSGANLTGAQFEDGSMDGANLRGANLTRMLLYRTGLHNVDLTGANLTGVALQNWDLMSGADLSGANLKNTIWYPSDGDPSASIIFDTSTIYNQWTMFPAGFEPAAAGLTFVPSPIGDFNADDMLDHADLKILREGIESFRRYGDASPSREMLDLNADEAINQEDLNVWVLDLKNAYFGDADLDGNVDFADFVTLANHFDGPGGWGDGDFDADGKVLFADFVILANNYGKTSAANTMAVPEPGSVSLALLGVALHAGVRNRKRR